MVSLLHADSGKYIVSNTHRILRNRAWLIISPLQERIADNVLIEENQSPVLFQQVFCRSKACPQMVIKYQH
jgi:tRNA(Ile)-lysidine synthase